MRANLARAIVACLSAALVLVGCARTAPGPADSSSSRASTASTAAEFAATVTPDAVLAHLREIETISMRHPQFRSYDSPGYEEAAVYVEGKLREAGYEPTRSPLQIIIERSRESALEVDGEPIAHEVLSSSRELPAEGVRGQLVAASDDFGCSEASYPEPLAGRIAIAHRGSACTFGQRADVAERAGALALIIVNQADEPLYGTLGSLERLTTFSVTAGVGQRLVAAAEAGGQAVMTLQAERTKVDTFSIIADTPGGSDADVLMVGAHLDGAPYGPGSNDNGSGAATVVEVARQFAGTTAFRATDAKRVRFVWWGAEEIGLRGSMAWVNDKTDAELAAVKAYLNFDMLGSSNYVIGVHDGSATMHPTKTKPPAGSDAITRVFTDWFDSTGQPFVLDPFDGRSDYQPFVLRGIPSGGIATGADGIKTDEEAAAFGGLIGAPHDANYHKVTDTVANLNTDALAIMVPAAAAAVWAMANQ